MKQTFIQKKFKASSLEIIDKAIAILEEYGDQGYTLTLRQLYYQFVARDYIENTQRSYKNLGSIINDARLAGLIDWSFMVDRTRSLQRLSTWHDPHEILEGVAEQYQIDKWATQDTRVEVWVEKDALIDVVAQACDPLQVDYFSCRGYVSQSSMYEAAQRIRSRDNDTVIIHLGDHDPSGIDMTRDIYDRLDLMTYGGAQVTRIALSMEQIEKFTPPPNPTKLTDSRAEGYVNEYGYESWELDALEPSYIREIIEAEVLLYRDAKLWNEAVAEEEAGRERLHDYADTEAAR